MAEKITRRAALAAAGSALAVLHGRQALAADLPLLHVSMAPIFVVAPHVVADRMGFFAAEGIAVTTQPVQSGNIGIPGLMSGSFDILYSNSVAVLTALERGLDLRIIAEGTRIAAKPPVAAALLQRKDGGMHTGRDLEGKTIGIATKYDIQWLIAQAWIKLKGGDPSKVTYREMPLPSMLDALASNQVDAVVAIDPFLAVGLGDARFGLLSWAQADVMPGMPSSMWVITGETAKSKRELIHAYLRGFYKGAEWVDEHLGDPEYMKLVASFTKTDPALLAKMALNKQPLDVDPKQIERVAALMKDNGLLKTDLDIAAHVFE
ncbi:MAG TPA: ABC transporter substrate-binding protein [Stellaceae bacterium]|jgi:NitT/TauT family transport system substrate-binding protein|nr:ABC transporter substrate-binding protein [Stellaceae bacterium]